MIELANNTASATSLAIQKVVTDAGYRVHDLFYAAQKRSVILVVDLKTSQPMRKEDLDKFVAALLENVPIIHEVAIDFSMVKRTGGFPSFLLTTSGWN